MKKLFLIVIVFLLCACDNNKVNINYTYDIQTNECDMSGYETMSNQKHCFKKIKVDELYKCCENDSSGIFYLGYDTCPFCNRCIEYLNEVGMSMGVTIYYIDATNPEDKILGENDAIRQSTNFLEPILDTIDEGKKVLMTPHVFTIVNGEFYDSYVSLPYKKNGDLDFDNPPTTTQIKTLESEYKKLFKPFVS